MSETATISAAIDVAVRYYRSMVAGDEAELRRLFDARAPIVGHFEGDFMWQDLDAFIAEAKSLVGQHGQEECRVEGVRVDGDIAMVEVGGRYSDLWFIDHLAMVQVEGHWRIVAKTFHVAS